jgi:hypothetical protein
MPCVTSVAEPIHLGMDVSKNTIVVGILVCAAEVPLLDRPGMRKVRCGAC